MEEVEIEPRRSNLSALTAALPSSICRAEHIVGT